MKTWGLGNNDENKRSAGVRGARRSKREMRGKGWNNGNTAGK